LLGIGHLAAEGDINLNACVVGNSVVMLGCFRRFGIVMEIYDILTVLSLKIAGHILKSTADFNNCFPLNFHRYFYQ